MPEGSWEGPIRHYMMKVGAVLAPIVLTGIALVHALLPKRLTLDWQTVVLLLVGILLAFLPMRELAAMVKSLQLGDVKILLNESKDLGESTEEAERAVAEAELPQARTKDQELPSGPGESPEKLEEHEPIGSSGIRPLWRVLGEVNQIAVVSPKAALLRLASLIEHAVVILATKTSAVQPTQLTLFRQVVTGLVKNGTIPSSLGDTLFKFMAIRNKIAHESLDSTLEDEVVRTTVRDGLSLYRLVLIVAQSKIGNDDPYDGETISLI